VVGVKTVCSAYNGLVPMSPKHDTERPQRQGGDAGAVMSVIFAPAGAL